MHDERATAQLKGKRHARNLFRTGEKLDAHENECKEALRLADENFENPTPTCDIKMKSGGAVTVCKPAKKYGDMHRTWGKCTTCVSKNFIDLSFAFYCYTCLDNTLKILADGEYLLPSFKKERCIKTVCTF